MNLNTTMGYVVNISALDSHSEMLLTLFMAGSLVRSSLASSPGLRGVGKGRPGTHCMRMRHYSPDFGESGYVWILSIYLHCKLRIQSYDVRVTYRRYSNSAGLSAWQAMGVACDTLSFVEKKMSEFLNRATESLGSTVLPQNRQTFTFMVAIAPIVAYVRSTRYARASAAKHVALRILLR